MLPPHASERGVDFVSVGVAPSHTCGRFLQVSCAVVIEMMLCGVVAESGHGLNYHKRSLRLRKVVLRIHELKFFLEDEIISTVALDR